MNAPERLDPTQPSPLRKNEKAKVDVQTLLRGSTEVCLLHQGVEYRLRVTKQGKLLLTK